MFYFIVQNTNGSNLRVCETIEEALKYMTERASAALAGYRIEVMKRYD